MNKSIEEAGKEVGERLSRVARNSHALADKAADYARERGKDAAEDVASAIGSLKSEVMDHQKDLQSIAQRAGLDGTARRVIDSMEQTYEGIVDKLDESLDAITSDDDSGEAKTNGDADGESRAQSDNDIDATVAARTKARELGIALSEVQGSGARGKVTIEDLEHMMESGR